MEEAVAELLASCVGARAKGADFPTIWSTFLARHPLIVGMPRSSHGVLVVPLVTGDQLVFGDGFSITERGSSMSED